MQTLLTEDYAPLTSSIGFIDASIKDVAYALVSWRQSLDPGVTSRTVTTPFPEVLHSLEPLTLVDAPRELLLPTDSSWTAYFENSARGADAASPIRHLTHTNHWRGVVAEAIPHTVGLRGVKRGRFGSVQFQLFGERPTEFINYVRTLAVAYDGNRWVFDEGGTPQAFEHPEQYKQKRIRDRFTVRLLDEYCRALGIRVFDPSFYRSPGVFIETPMILAPEDVPMSLKEAQSWLEIKSGQLISGSS